MVFEYTFTADTLVESFWAFSIPSQGIVVPFLLVGHVTEPRVTLDRPAINFGRVSCTDVATHTHVLVIMLLTHTKNSNDQTCVVKRHNGLMCKYFRNADDMPLLHHAPLSAGPTGHAHQAHPVPVQ